VTTPRHCQLVGLGTAVNAVVVRPTLAIVIDGAVAGEIAVGRGGMICNTLAVAAALGARTCGIVASGDDHSGALMRTIVDEAGVVAEFVSTRRTPVTVTIAADATRSSIMGVDGEREADLEADAVTDAWGRLGAQPSWAMLTLPALDSPAGARFVELARAAGAAVAVTLSSVGHVQERSTRLDVLLGAIDLVFGNGDEVSALNAACVSLPLLIATEGGRGATIFAASQTHVVPAAAAEVIDTTGAGDAFAGGVLATLDPVDIAPLNLAAIEHAVRTGHQAAAVVINLLGAEPGPVGRARLSAIPARLGAFRPGWLLNS
jgi:ribokinase